MSCTREAFLIPNQNQTTHIHDSHETMTAEVEETTMDHVAIRNDSTVRKFLSELVSHVE